MRSLIVEWVDVAKTNGRHCHVFVAEGSRASYPNEIDLGGTYCTDYPRGQADVAVFDAHTSVEWRAWAGIGPKLLEVACWFGFGGAWGGHRHIDTLLEPLSADASGPVGPPYNSEIIEFQELLAGSRPA